MEQVLKTEEERFRAQLERGLALLDEETGESTGRPADGRNHFPSYDMVSQVDLTADVCREPAFIRMVTERPLEETTPSRAES